MSPLQSVASSHSSHSSSVSSMRLVQNVGTGCMVVLLLSTLVCLHIQQWLGVGLRCISRSWFYAWQASVKESTSLLLLSFNAWCNPSVVQISGDASVRGQIRRTPKGKGMLAFPKRMILIANHQIYTDWIFLWWAAYASGTHGGLIIILKDSLRKIPIFGVGMVFFDWIFLSRRWETDEKRLHEGLSRLAGPRGLDAMWLLIFPEGTNLSQNNRNISATWAAQTGVSDYKHVLIPRTRGLRFCVSELQGSIDWLYDCTIAYAGIGPSEFGQDLYTLKTLYFGGQKAPRTHIHWRRFAVADIPANNAAFEEWIHARWAEKDALMEHFALKGVFPADDGYVEVPIVLNRRSELLKLALSVLSTITVSHFMLLVLLRAYSKLI